MAMAFGLLIIEVMVELSAGITLIGGKDGLFISRSESALGNAKIVNTPLRIDVRVIQTTDIREQPTLHANKVGKLESGTKLRTAGKTTVNDEVWYQVTRFGGKIGYIPGNTVLKKKPSPN